MNKVLIVGGSGFIGINAAEYYLKKNDEVTIFDNFSREGTLKNLDWLQRKYKKKLNIVQGDIRLDQYKLEQVVEGKDLVLHLAAQVTVTTSITNPREDFEINALGSFNVLEAIRKADKKPVLIYASTNKVYGGMEDIKIHEVNGRYEYEDMPNGIPENRILDFHSPYGCSKGCADQYVRDYARIYNLKTVVLRQSCIYGYRQFGVEDQGWVAWFTIATILNKPITIYGDGKQVRDVLFIDDLIKAYDLAYKNIKTTSGKVYNIGGGPNNQMSLHELLKFLEEFIGKKIKCKYSDWRPGDQPVFVCDISKAKIHFGWESKVGVKQGVKKLAGWVKKNQKLFI